METRQSWWPYVLALVSALLAPSAFRHALEEEQPKGSSVVETAAPTGAKVPAKPIEPGLEHDWTQFLCSYANPKLPSGQYCDPALVPPGAEFLIAGVPDPEATSIPATFDVMVEALIGAAAAEDWRYDRYWLPWGRDAKDDKKATPANPSLTNDQPGLLLFRRDDKLLLVFLVGETPTAGVSKTALFNAARFIFEHQGKLRILGPRFSGSVPSYKQTLQRLADQKVLAPVHFVTGSATREANLKDLFPYLFEATIENDARTQELFLQWLETRGIKRSEVATLSEAGTAFGAAFRGASTEMLQVEFPYQISRLRNAYEKDPELRAIWMDASAQAKDSKLEWSLKSEKDGTDRVPTFQGPQTTLLQERQLEQVTRAICQHGIRAAAINATDVLDTVFLTLLLRRKCPDLHVFTLDSDLLFTYASGALSFNGMLMVSPYPLWLDNALYFQTCAPRFLNADPNRSAVGVHNAFIRLAGGERYRDYWSPFMSDRPPLWVTAVGRGEIWPLAILDEETIPATQLAPGAIRSAGLKVPWKIDPHWSYWMFLCVFSGLVVYATAVYTARRIAEQRWLGDSFDPAFFCLFEPPDRTFERTAYVQTACAFGLVALLPFTIRLGWGLCAAMAAMFLFTTLTEERRAKAAWLALALGAAIAIPVVFWIRHHLSPADHERFFFEYRLLHPAGGLSPLTPWTLAWLGCTWWAVLRINLLRAREVRSPRIESWPCGEPMLAGLNRTVQEAAQVTGPMGFTKGFLVYLVILLVMVWWALPQGLWSLERELEPWGWVAGAAAGIFLLTLLQLQVLVQMFLAQRSAIDILNALVDHPLGDAFDRLPKEMAASKLWLRGGNRHSFQSCIQGVRRLRLMPPVAEAWPAVEPALSRLLERAAAGLRVEATDLGALHESLNRIAAQVYPALTASWKSPGATKLPVEEEFVALRLAALVRHMVIQMRSKMEYLSFGLVMLILSVISYPFQPQNGLVYMVAAMVAATGITVFYTVTRLDRHPVMQKFASQKEAASFGDTIRKVAAFGFAPLVATFTALFPGTVRSLSSFIEAAGKYLGN